MPKTLQSKNSNPSFTEEEVKIALVIKKMTQQSLAQKIGHAQGTVNVAIKTGAFPNVRRKIQKALKL